MPKENQTEKEAIAIILSSAPLPPSQLHYLCELLGMLVIFFKDLVTPSVPNLTGKPRVRTMIFEVRNRVLTDISETLELAGKQFHLSLPLGVISSTGN